MELISNFTTDLGDEANDVCMKWLLHFIIVYLGALFVIDIFVIVLLLSIFSFHLLDMLW